MSIWYWFIILLCVFSYCGLMSIVMTQIDYNYVHLPKKTKWKYALAAPITIAVFLFNDLVLKKSRVYNETR